MGKLYEKFLNFLVDKKLYSETWYYYLTGEWRANFPDELRRWQTFLDSQRKFYSLLPSDPHCHDGVTDLAVLGNAANICARLSSKAAAGEILISAESVKSGKLEVAGLESRSLELKGVSQPASVRVMKVSKDAYDS